VLSPVVRRLLGEHDLRADDITGSGRDGRITRADVFAAAARPAAAPAGAAPRSAAAPPAPPAAAVERGPDDDVVPFTRARRSTAEHMVRSQRTSAHTLVAVQVDYHAVDAARAAGRLSYLPFVARAVLAALRSFPHLNASVGDDELIVHRRIHLGVAVDVDGEALVVPVVHDADLLRLEAIAASVADLAARARARRLTAAELSGGTFTITNVGRYGTVVTAPVINQPQVAILSTDGVRMTPVAVATADGGWAVAVHPVGNLSLSFDHRAVDGAYAAGFLALVRDHLETHPWSTELSPGAPAGRTDGGTR
jgi:2-oxoglutarate dehydrogenase E2 component (dihydrolipoamide succinyltransferase)